MKRHYSRSDRPAHKLMKATLTPDLPAFNPGTTRRDKIDGTEARMNATGETAAQCWCGKGFVGVTLDEVRACKTRPCGRPGCKEK